MNRFYFPTIKKHIERVDLNKLSQILEYNVGNGKMIRFKIFKQLLNELNPDYDENLLIFGYAIELIQSGFLIIDDIMDNSEYRRGKECHYKIRGRLGLRDGRFLVSLGAKLIRDIDTFIGTDTIYITSVGQSLDSMEKKIEDYKFDLYRKICETKTSFYSFYLPLYLSYKCSSLESPQDLKKFCMVSGYIFQVYDDYLNFVPEVSKKTGNDLEEGKLTFFTALMGEHRECERFSEYFIHRKIEKTLIEFIQSNYSHCKTEIESNICRLTTMVEYQNKELRFLIELLKTHTANLCNKQV